jgi:phenylacetate-coenzyme A ligase PaaK-like adenylate-forming protein
MLNKKNFTTLMYELTKFHYKECKEYKKILDVVYDFKNKKEVEFLPFLSTKLFKEFDLKSIPNEKIFKILNSSGTSDNRPSRIFLDKENAKSQTRVLNELVSKVIGNKRIPMLIVDEKKNIQNPKNFDAKTAAILGFSIFGTKHTYLIENSRINYKNLNQFLNKYSDKDFFIFGFTSFIFENLLENLDKKKIKKNFSKGILIHGGGWKKLENRKISNEIFKQKLKNKLNLKNVINYYGLIEQTGSIFFECEKCETFSPSKYSNILIRDKNFNVLEKNQKGFIQLMSLLPKSYPGHNILTEDIGEIVEKDCVICKNKTKFLVHGRAEKSEIRGCSDV